MYVRLLLGDPLRPSYSKTFLSVAQIFVSLRSSLLLGNNDTTRMIFPLTPPVLRMVPSMKALCPSRSAAEDFGAADAVEQHWRHVEWELRDARCFLF